MLVQAKDDAIFRIPLMEMFLLTNISISKFDFIIRSIILFHQNVQKIIAARLDIFLSSSRS